MYRLFLSLMLVTPTAARAEILTSARLAVGVHTDGSLVDDDDTVGISYDPDDAPMGDDLITPGRSFEVFGLRFISDQRAVEHTSAGPYKVGTMPFEWDAVQHNAAFTWRQGTADLTQVRVQVSVDLPLDDDVFWINVRVTANEPVEQLEVYRVVDSDPDYFVDRSYRTSNLTGEGYAVSSSLRSHGKALALGVQGGSAYICSWCSSASTIHAAQTTPADGDLAIAVISEPVDLAAGQTVHLRFAYALGTSQEDAVNRIMRAISANDMDNDGVAPADGDCDDRDPLTSPAATELADGVDNDCDGEVDEGTAAVDDDGDGYSEWDGDCDDDDAQIYPGADAIDGVHDADCDGLADDGGFREDDRPNGWGEPDGERPTSACGTMPVPLSSFALFLLLLPSIRRRRGHL